MAQLISVKLSRFDGSPWGFRLQGGKDFGTPLIVQKVNGGSPAEAAGLKAGDAVIRVNNTDMFNLRHKDAQDVIVRAGNNFEMTIQRGGSTWKPCVTPIGSTLPSPTPSIPATNVSPVTKTSLVSKKQDGPLIGSGHNFSPKPFLNGTGEGSIKSIVNKQYNSPVGIYSEETIAETLSAQAEVLAGGVLGVNFKKNEKNYNAENSEVFKMVQEADKEPKTPEPVHSWTEFYSSASHAVGGRATSPKSLTPLCRSRGLCQTISNSCESSSLQEVEKIERRQKYSSSSLTSSDSPICHNCDNAIVGVFVRIKDKNLHVDCFKCSTCGTSLKNVGYYNINEKLYCDIHAKMVARQQVPTGLTPITVPPVSKAPAGTISAALSNVGPLSPPLNNHGSSPLPFSAPSSNNTGGSKLYSGTTLNTPTFNSGGCTLPRQQSHNVTANEDNTNQQINGQALIPVCCRCNIHIRRGPFITALGQIWCPEHFVCGNVQCNRGLQDIGFVEEKGQLYCEYCFEKYIAPPCDKCGGKIKGDCLNAVGKHFHPECFNCSHCGKLFGNSPFFLEEGLPYCENDWNNLFTTKCYACGFPVEAGDRWVEALNNNYHSQCFNCTMCKKNLEGQSFYAKGGRPFCKNHAR
ncbi:PDZ and LIM domain protein Zasp isoform X10 [Leptopilina boulardi]|uniref:PDZ and LIM domain protein Zasp isoform X10 n=1 Tax=Leptopilina boulardi TaxID=63433 RepID=UPI0021F53397|nr:PDZ and LIM domain protein Zasp isoform X10 [Leptopilina boulardi]